jgi:hypothetical protein
LDVCTLGLHLSKPRANNRYGVVFVNCGLVQTASRGLPNVDVRDGLSGLKLDMSFQTCTAALSSVPELQGVHLFSVNKIGIAAVAPHLAALSSLQSLDPRYSVGQGDGAAALGPHLAALLPLQNPDLSFIDLQAVGTTALSLLLTALLSLQDLNQSFDNLPSCWRHRTQPPSQCACVAVAPDPKEELIVLQKRIFHSRLVDTLTGRPATDIGSTASIWLSPPQQVLHSQVRGVPSHFGR